MAYFRAGTARATHEAQQITVAKTPLATFESNVSGLYLPEILAYITAAQSGTGDPSPINQRPIIGVNEVTTACNAINQWDEQWEIGAYNNDGEKIANNNTIRSKNTIPVFSGMSYYFKAPITSPVLTIRLVQYDANMNCLSSVGAVGINRILTLDSECRFIAFNMSTSYGKTYNNDISINYPSTDTAYHAYTGTTATTALGGTYYGGYLNVQTGLLIVTHVDVDLGSLNWTYDSTNQKFYTSSALSGADSNKPLLCDIYKYVGSFTQLVDKTCSNIYNTRVGIKDLDYTDPTTFKTAMSGHTLLYELATPQTYQLTPAQLEQLLGENNVFASTGDVAVKYWRID